MATPLDDLKAGLRAFIPACEQAEVILKLREHARTLIADGERVAQMVLREEELKKSIADLDVIFQTRRESGLAEIDRDLKEAARPVERARAEAEATVTRVRRETIDAIAAREADRKMVEQSLERAQRDLGQVNKAIEERRAEAKRVEAEENAAADKRRAALRGEIGELEQKLIALKREDAEIQQRLESLVRRRG